MPKFLLCLAMLHANLVALYVTADNLWYHGVWSIIWLVGVAITGKQAEQ